jgi:branched-chain amino acid aminotransferase
LTHGLHYGTGVFEGIRCYETARGPAIFRHADHLARLEKSAELYYLEIPYAAEELRQATHELLRRCDLKSAYIRPLAFRGYGELGLYAKSRVDVVIAAWPWGAYLGEEALSNGIRVKISTWQRIPPNVVPHASKATGVYLNSMLAVSEAQRAGYDEAIMLTPEGTVADGPGETIFVVRDGRIYTPDLSTGILHGITRDSVIHLAHELGYEVAEKHLIRSDLYLADEVFMCGTAAEVTPVRSVDDQEIGVGPVTVGIQKAYLDAVRGGNERWSEWCELVPSMSQAA